MNAMPSVAATDTSGQEVQEPRRLDVDILVIGWGKGGKTFAGKMAAAGKSVVMVEQSAAMYGGTCINIGCVPTKTLIHSASEKRAADGDQKFFEDAVGYRDSLIGKLNDVNFHMLADQDTVTVVDGRARFVGPREVEITPSAGGRGLAESLRITAETVVINTGATPVMPPIDGIDLPGVYDSTSIQHADPFPQRLAIIGGGPIGLEFASMFSNFGSQVTVIARGETIMPNEDDDVRGVVLDVLSNAGITLRTSASAEAIEARNGALAVALSGGGSIEADAVLVATGRKPATEGLNLEAAGVEVDENGAVVVDDHLRTTAEGVYAMGDVHGGPQQTYLSLDDSRVVMSALTGDGSRRVSSRVAVPTTTFLTPPLSAVGVTEDGAHEAGRSVKTATAMVADIKAMPRPKAVQDPRGVIKFVVDAETDLVLGARLFHVDSQEVINLVALAMRAGVTASELRDGIWTHPSSTEALNEVLGQLE